MHMRDNGGCRAQEVLDGREQKKNYVNAVYIYEIKIKEVMSTYQIFFSYCCFYGVKFPVLPK